MATGTETQPGTTSWELDATHSSIEFAIKHMMMTTVRGRFKTLSGTITGDQAHLASSRVQVEIDVASIDTGAPDRDTHLKSADFFDAEKYPKINFRSKRIEGAFGADGDQFRVIGDLTIRDTTMEITLDCVFEGRGQDPWGKQRAGFSAKGEIDRREWGLKWNQAMETGGILVANKVRIDVEAQFVQGT